MSDRETQVDTDTGMAEDAAWQPLLDRTIAAFAEGDLTGGRLACDRLLSMHGVPWQVVKAAGRNSVFYAPEIADLLPGWRERELELPAAPGWQSFNPSIAARPEGGAIALVRQGNFRLEPPTTYVTTDGDAAFRSRYRVVDLDADLEAVGPSRELRVDMPDDGRAWPEVPDIEDLRLFRVGDRWLAAGSQSCRVPGRPRREVRFGLFGLDLDPADSRIVSVQWLANGMSGITEKNWMPVGGQELPAFVYSSGPTAVVVADPATGQPGLAALNGAPPLAERFRGGSQAIPVADGFLALVHEVAFWEDEARSYLHRLVRYDAGFRLTHCSHPFRLFGENIEFAAGLALVGERLAISFGVDDAEAWIGDAPLAEAMELLLPIAHLAPDGPLDPEMPEGLEHVLGIAEPEEIDLPDTWEGLQQRSIDAFYENRPEEGRLACDRLLNRPDAPDVSRLFARRNAIHYAPDLRDLAPGYREAELDFEMPPGWFAVNPTVAADPAGGLAVLVRGSNWSAAHGGPHPESGELGARSVYVALTVDQDLEVTEDLGPVADRSPDAGDRYLPIQGNEDYRLFRLGDRWMASASAWRLRPDGQPAIRVGLWDVDLAAAPPAADRPRWLADGASGAQEKNWMPAVDGDALLFVHTCGPTAVVRCDPETGALSLAHLHPAPLMAGNFRGGSQLVAHDGGWLALVHDIALTPERNRVYLHRLVRFGPDFAITHASHPFRFHGQPIEFAAGLARAGDRFVLSFGVADDSAWLASVPADELIALLLPVAELAPGGPVEQPLPSGLEFVLGQWASRVEAAAAASRRVKEPPAAPSMAGLRPIPPREDGLPTIASVTLSGNSRDVIGDAIRSAVDWLDAAIVVDTGITDDTLEVARAAAGDRLMVAEFPWIDDFAAARNFALAAAAAAGADWAVNLDTDERIDLRGDDVRAILAAATGDAVFVNHETGHYKKERFFRMPLSGEYVGPTHECWIGGARSTLPNAVFDELGKSDEQLEGKLERDRAILERHTAERPDDPRWWYYLADTQSNLGRHEEAIASFSRCMAIGGWDEEAGWSAYRAARILGDELKRWDEAEAMAARGLLHHPAMVDLYWVAGYSAFWGGHYQRAANWARTAIAINAQAGAGLFVERGGFKYPPAEREAPWDVLRHALRRLGDEAGADAAERRHAEIVAGGVPREPRDEPEEPDPAGLAAAPDASLSALRAAPLETLVERSIQAFWEGDLETGRLACDLILSHPEASPELRDNTRRNAVHYAPVLSRSVPGYASRALQVELPEGWFAFNPSIARHDGRLVMLVRCANYALPGWVIAPGDDRYRSRYVAVDLDADGRPRREPYPLVDWTGDDAHRSARTEGVEDLRLVELDGRLLASGSAMREVAPGVDVVCLGLFDVSLEGRAIGNPRWLSDGSSGVPEKNWMPVVDGGRLRFVHSCGPTAVLDCVPATGRLELAALHDASAIAAGLRGGTPLAAHAGGWLALAHETAEWDRAAGKRTYLHRVVRFDRELRITHLSHPFRFEGEEIEFAAGLVLDGDRALVSFGVGDREARLATLPLPDLFDRLVPLDHLLPTDPAGSQLPAGLSGLLSRWAGDAPPETDPPADPVAEVDRVLAWLDPAQPRASWALIPALASRIDALQRRRIAASTIAEVRDFGQPVAEPLVSVITPLYRRLDDIGRQARAFAADPDAGRIEVVYVLDSPDDADAAIEAVERACGETGILLRLAIVTANGGYGRATNLGASLARAPWLLLLNADAWPAAGGWASRMTAFAGSVPDAGLIGPKVVYPDGRVHGDGNVYVRDPELPCWTWRTATWGADRSDARLAEPRPMSGMGTAAALVSRARFAEAGGFAEEYVTGQFEDCDLSNRMRALGWTNWYFPRAEFVHEEARSYVGRARRSHRLYNAWVHQRRWGDVLEREFGTEAMPAVAPGADPETGYRGVLARMHEAIRPCRYLEIGVHGGATLALSRCEAIGIDPDPRPESQAVVDERPADRALYRMTSDAFFAAPEAAERLAERAIDFAFIDGFHSCEQVIRDFINVERWSSPGTVVAIHDVIPPTQASASPEQIAGWWVGDVWRAVGWLKSVRPDLDIRIVGREDAPPSGLLVVMGLDPTSTALKARFAEASAAFGAGRSDYAADLERHLADIRTVPLEGLLLAIAGRRRGASGDEGDVRDLPIYVPAFNNPTYLGNMLGQLRGLGLRPAVVDNASTSPRMRRFLDTLGDVPLVRRAANLGPHGLYNDPGTFAQMPALFAVTDPDLELNKDLPPDFLERLIDLTRRFRVGKAGFALDVSDPETMRQERFTLGGEPRRIWEWEAQFWDDELERLPSGDPVYRADIDTTFAVWNREFFQVGGGRDLAAVRVAGRYTARHLPWYRDHALVPPDEAIEYRATGLYSSYEGSSAPAARPVTVRGVTFHATVDSTVPGYWDWVNAGTWEPGTFRALERLLGPGSTFVDCGGWIGPTTLYAAATGARVTTFECDPVARDELLRNLALNPEMASRVTVIGDCLSDHDGTLALFADALGHSDTSAFPLEQRTADARVRQARLEAPCRDVRGVFADHRWLDDPRALVKLDVEGSEYPILAALGTDVETACCSFLVSFHPSLLVGDDAARTAHLRSDAAMAWSAQFADFDWIAADGDALVSADRNVVLAEALAGRPHGPILFLPGSPAARSAAASEGSPRIVDCFTFLNELDLLEIRLDELGDVVDAFVLVEGTRTYSGAERSVRFDPGDARWERFRDRIVHVVVDDFPETDDPWRRERHQRDAIERGLDLAAQRFGSDPEDLVLVSDIDEIPRAQAVRWLHRVLRTGRACLTMRLFHYRLDRRVQGGLGTTAGWIEWSGTMAVRRREYSGAQALRDARNLPGTLAVPDAGWHFSYMGGAAAIVGKIRAFSHQELNTAEHTDEASIQARIDRGLPLFSRSSGDVAVVVDLDESFPAAIRRDPDRFAALLENPLPIRAGDS